MKYKGKQTILMALIFFSFCGQMALENFGVFRHLCIRSNLCCDLLTKRSFNVTVLILSLYVAIVFIYRYYLNVCKHQNAFF